jgi:primary-amine oxidase
MTPTLHPFSQLTAPEIRQTSRIIAQLYPDGVALIFKTITLYEPDKTLALEYLKAEHENRVDRPAIDRQSFVAYYKKDEVWGLLLVPDYCENGRRLTHLV